MSLQDDHAWGEEFAVSNKWKNCMSLGLSSINILSYNEALAKSWVKYSLRFIVVEGLQSSVLGEYSSSWKNG